MAVAPPPPQPVALQQKPAKKTLVGGAAAAVGAGGATDKKTDAPLLPPTTVRVKKPSHVSITVLDPVPPSPSPPPDPVVVPPLKKKAVVGSGGGGPSVAALANGIAALEPILWIVCSLLVTVAHGASAPATGRPQWLKVLTAAAALLVEAYFLFVMVLWRNYAAGAASNRWTAVAAAVALAFAANAVFLFQFVAV